MTPINMSDNLDTQVQKRMMSLRLKLYLEVHEKATINFAQAQISE